MEAGIHLVQIYLVGYRSKDLKPYLDRLEKLAPNDLRVKLLAAHAYRFEAKEDQAIELVTEVLDKEPDNFDALQLRGNLELQLKHPAEAEFWFRKALAQEPGSPVLLYNLYRALSSQKNREQEARKILDQQTKAKAANARLLEILQKSSHLVSQDANLAAEAGHLLLQLHKEKAGLYWLEMAVRLDPEQQAARSTLIAYYTKRGEEGDAERARWHRTQRATAGKGPPPLTAP